jgi:glycerol-3-phosphate dehydrogenase
MHPADGRVLFAVPWGDCVYVGTTDTDFDGDPAEVAATREDVDYLLAACVAYFPNHPVTDDDVISTWAGLRPLIAPEGGGDDVDESAVSREHQIIVGRDGLVTIAGGKLTTYRRMAAEVVDTVVRLLRMAQKRPADLRDPATEHEPLPGGIEWPDDDDHDAVAAKVRDAGKGRITPKTARYLTDTYGMRAFEVVELCLRDASLAEAIVPGRPEVMAQVDFGVQEELAGTVTDVLSRRTQIFLRDHDQGLGAVERVAARMASLLGWDDAHRAKMEDAYRNEVALSRRWRTE